MTQQCQTACHFYFHRRRLHRCLLITRSDVAAARRRSAGRRSKHGLYDFDHLRSWAVPDAVGVEPLFGALRLGVEAANPALGAG